MRKITQETIDKYMLHYDGTCLFSLIGGECSVISIKECSVCKGSEDYRNINEEWIFTFCGRHEHSQGFVAIVGTYGEARAEMFKRYGDKWCFQYKSREEAGVYQYDLYEVKDK